MHLVTLFITFCYDANLVKKAFQNKTWRKEVVESWKNYWQIKDLVILSGTFQVSWISKVLVNAEWFAILGGTQLKMIDNG